MTDRQILLTFLYMLVASFVSSVCSVLAWIVIQGRRSRREWEQVIRPRLDRMRADGVAKYGEEKWDLMCSPEWPLNDPEWTHDPRA